MTAGAAFVNVLDDPHYWKRGTPIMRDWVALLITAVVGVVVVAIMAAVFKTTASNNDHWLKMERQCLDQGGQWIKNDCVNNIIKLNG